MSANKKFWCIAGTLLASCVIGVATPGSGFLFNNFVRGTVVTGKINEHAHAKRWNLNLSVEGKTDFVQQDVALVSGGYSGWHSHPGPALIVIKSGTANWYNADDPNCQPTIYPTGSSFVEPANLSHYVSNLGSSDLELLVTYIIPEGAATRQEQPQPAVCPF